eukprot:CAMPEP_0171984976 /NCGR_PEP_ID=MMETSP0993-20121228/274106_1 /TAXON_ID=483369 /ORGANISM="non described non described, Strain CCMP2098" /LENGTH=1046 /DNA_ID=CAMNT_0012637817 /DNA_START=144 /DNA_END=3282 /DNA_ORIENTATION=+
MSGLGEPPLPASAKIRPRHGKLELTTSMVTGYGDDPHFDNECSDRQRIADHVFASSEVKMQAHFVCGAMRGGALHLTPVRRVLQVRPSFHHVDRADDKEAQMEALGAQNYRDEADDMDDDGGGDGGGGGAAAAGKAKSKAAAAGKPPPPPASSSAGFARRESEHAKAARLKSWAYQQSSELSEAFVTLDVHGSDSAESAHEWDRLFADQALGPKEKTSGEGVGCGRGGGGSNGSGQHLTRRQLQGEGVELEFFSCPAPFSIATLLGKGGFGAVKVEAEKESNQRASQQKSSHSKNFKNMKKQIGDFDSDDDGDGEVGGLTLASRRHSLSKESLCVLAARASALVAGASGGGGRAKAESLVFSDGEEEEEEEENEGGEDDDRDGLKDSDDEFEGDGRFGSSSSSRGRVKDEEGGGQLGADKESKAARRARRARRRRQWAQMLNSAGPLNLGTAASSDIGGGSGGSGGGRRDPSFGGLDHASRVFCFAAAHALVEEFGRPATLAAAASELNLQLNSNFNSDSNSLNSDSTSLQGSSSTLSSRQQHSSSGMLQGDPAPIPYSALSALAHAAAAFNSSSSSSSAVGGGSVGITASLLLDCLAWFSLLFPVVVHSVEQQQHSSSGMLQGDPAPIPYSALSALAHAAAAFNSSSSSSSAVGGGSVGITASLLLDCLAWFSLLFPQAGSPFRGAATYNYLSDGSAVSGGGTVKPKVPTAAAPPSAAAAAAGARSRVLGGKGGGGGGGDEGAVGRSRDERGLEASAAALSAAVAGAKEQQDQWRREKEGGAGGDDAFSALVASSSSSGIVAPGEGWWTSAAASGRKGAGSSGRGVVPWGGAEEDGDAAGTQGAYRGLTTFQAAVAKVLQNEAYAGSLLHAAFTLEALEGELLPSAHALADLEGAAPVSSSSRGMDDDDDLDSQSKSQSKAGAPKASVVASLSHAILRRCSVVPVGLVASLVQTALTNFHASPAASGAQGRGSKGLDAGLDAGTTTAGAAANDVINTKADDVAVLVAAERFGVVVRGNWVVRSEVLYCAQGGGGRNAMLEFVGLG